MQKTLYVEALDSDIIIAKRRGTRNVRLSMRSDGQIRLTVPYGVSEKYALHFLQSKMDWLQKNKKTSVQLRDGDHIGKSHQIVITAGSESIKTRVTSQEILIKLPDDIDPSSPEVQAKIRQACERALLQEAKALLPQRVEYLAGKYGISYNSLKIKKLKSRWGSCDSRKNLTLNSYLIQLDWQSIDYVITHELAHTKYQHHQASFWDFVEELMPGAKKLRKSVRRHPTDIVPTNY